MTNPTELPKWRTTGIFIKCYDTVHIGALGTDILVSGSGNDSMFGGSGVDLLVADGVTPAGSPRSLFGDGVNDGGTRGADVFRSLDGWNLLWDYQQGERIEIDGLARNPSLATLNGNWWLRLVTTPAETAGGIGSHETWAMIGASATTANPGGLTQAQAGTIANAYLGAGAVVIVSG